MNNTCRLRRGIRRFRACLRSSGLLTLACLAAACQGPRPVQTGPAVEPVIETEPVHRIGDAADDPAILVGGDSDPVWIVGTDKQFGLRVYNLQGDELHALQTGRLNNVDSLPLTDGGFVVAASNRTTPAIDLYRAHPASNEISLAARLPLDYRQPYGLCMARIAGDVRVYVGDKKGNVQEWTIAADDSGKLTASYRFDSQTEGCVVDTETGTLYVGEEVVGIWAVDLDDGSKHLVDRVGDGRLTADVEGLDIYREPEASYLIASSQGDNSYVIYRLPDVLPVVRFHIHDNRQLGIDGTSDTDGIAVTSKPLPGFPKGVLVVQDGYNVTLFRNQNFKVVDWQDVAALIDGADSVR